MEGLGRHGDVLLEISTSGNSTNVINAYNAAKEKQMKTLTENAAKAIQDWILENPEWIGMPPLDEAQATDLSASSADEISEVPLSNIEDDVADDIATDDADISTEAPAEGG